MRTKITLLLVFLNAVLFFFIFGFERKWRTEEMAREARRRVLGPETANIQALEISGRSLAATIRLERVGEAWGITAPYEWPANPHALTRIVNELQFLEYEASFMVSKLDATDLSLADYGLDQPTLQVAFTSGTGAGATTTALALGKKTDVGPRLYVLSPDGMRVNVVPDSLADSLSLDLEQLRANSCFTIPVFEIQSLNLQNHGPANVRVGLRREGNRWMFESPVVARASKTRTALALNEISALRTHDFLGAPSTQPDLVTTAGTDAPSLRITLEGNNRRETLLLGAEIPSTDPAASADREFYAQMENRDAIFTVIMPGHLAQSLRNAQSELRDRAVLDLEERRIDAVTLTDGDGREVVLQKLEPNPGSRSEWQIVQREPDGSIRTQPADPAVVEEGLLRHLGQLRATEFLRDVPTDTELEEWGLTRPARTISLSYEAGPGAVIAPGTTTLLIGTDQAGRQAFAKSGKETFVYRIDPAILESTPVDPLHFRPRLLRELPAGARITGLELVDLQDEAVAYAHTLAADQTWEAVFATAPPSLQPALHTLRQELRTLRAQRLVSDGFTATVVVRDETRSWRFRLTAELSLSGDEGEQAEDFSLFIADRDGGDIQLMGSPQLEVVFEAMPELIDAVWALTYAERDPGPPELVPPPAPDLAP